MRFLEMNCLFREDLKHTNHLLFSNGPTIPSQYFNAIYPSKATLRIQLLPVARQVLPSERRGWGALQLLGVAAVAVVVAHQEAFWARVDANISCLARHH